MTSEAYQNRVSESAAQIERRKRRVEDLARKLSEERHLLAVDEARHEGLLEGLQLADGPRASAPTTQRGGFGATAAKVRGGRQVGAITREWRRRLQHFYDLGAQFDVGAMTKILTNDGVKSSAAEVARTLSKHVEHGYLRLGPHNTYEVTELAAQRFGFASPKKTEAPDDQSGASSISVQGPAGLPSGSPTQLPTDGSIPSGSTPAKKGLLAMLPALALTTPEG